MSYIDNLDHKKIGEIAYFSVYQLLQDDFGPRAEFRTRDGSIVIGGGGGEHSPILINDLKYLVTYYLTDLIDELEIEEIKDEALDEELYSYLDKGHPMSTFNFQDWNVGDFYRLETHKRSDTTISSDISTEQWLIHELGKIIVDLNPELNPIPELTEKVKAYMENHIFEQINLIENEYDKKIMEIVIKDDKYLKVFIETNDNRNSWEEISSHDYKNNYNIERTYKMEYISKEESENFVDSLKSYKIEKDKMRLFKSNRPAFDIYYHNEELNVILRPYRGELSEEVITNNKDLFIIPIEDKEIINKINGYNNRIEIDEPEKNYYNELALTTDTFSK